MGGFCHESHDLKAKGARIKDFPFLLCFETYFSLTELFHQSETPCLRVEQILLQIMMGSMFHRILVQAFLLNHLF